MRKLDAMLGPHVGGHFCSFLSDFREQAADIFANVSNLLFIAYDQKLAFLKSCLGLNCEFMHLSMLSCCGEGGGGGGAEAGHRRGI